MAFCGNCGVQLTDGDEFCGACGTPVAPEAVAEAPVPPPVPTQPLPVPTPAPAPMPPPVVSAPPVPNASAAAPKRKLGPAVLIGIILAILLGLGCCGTAVVFGAKQFGVQISDFKISLPGSDDEGAGATTGTEDGSAADDSAAETSATETEDAASDASTDDGATTSDDSASGTLSMAESFDVLAAQYKRLWTLHTRIGLKNDSRPGGGTGFAYDDFNRNIGGGSKSQRQALAKRCEALLRDVDSAQQELIDAPIDPAYAEGQAKLLKLYGYHLARMRAMYDAAQIAIDSPAASAWRPALQPASGNAREAFEREYPKSKPKPL